jgi:hypothetical protein
MAAISKIVTICFRFDVGIPVNFLVAILKIAAFLENLGFVNFEWKKTPRQTIYIFKSVEIFRNMVVILKI